MLVIYGFQVGTLTAPVKSPLLGDGSLDSRCFWCYNDLEVTSMARQARQKSSTGIYHILLRGINRQVIFEDDEDKKKFLECVSFYKADCHYEVYGYCQMDNHIHLVIKENGNDIGAIMKRIGVRYVAWYNRKYYRCGHLFQDRFQSEPVETDSYLLTVLCYIHQNPVRAGLIQSLSEEWSSSYSAYFEANSLVDSSYILKMFSSDDEDARRQFNRFMQAADDVVPNLVYKEPVLLRDEEARVLIQQLTNIRTPLELQTMKKPDRDEMLRKIKQIEGLSTRQIARLTGISQSVIARA